MGEAKNRGGRPRVHLDDLMNQWRDGTQKRRSDIARTWPRSVRQMFTEMINRYPDSFTRPTECEEFNETYLAELHAWWDEPFGNDGVPINFDDGNLTSRVSREEMAEAFIYMAQMDVSAGTDWRTNPGFQPEYDQLLCGVAYTTAWQLRHAAGEGGGRPAMYDRNQPKPMPSWSHTDLSLIASKEFREMNIRIRNHEWFHARGEVYHVMPLPKTDGWVVDMIDGKTAYPEGVTAPTGEHGRKMVREVVQDQFGRLGIRLREQTVEEMAAEEQERLANTWVVSGWDYRPTKTPREIMRPHLAGTENEHLLEGYSDELIHYDLP